MTNDNRPRPRGNETNRNCIDLDGLAPDVAARTVATLAVLDRASTIDLADELTEHVQGGSFDNTWYACDSLHETSVWLLNAHAAVVGPEEMWETTEDLTDEALALGVLASDVTIEFWYACLSVTAESAGLCASLPLIGDLDNPRYLIQSLLALLQVRVLRLAAAMDTDPLLALRYGFPDGDSRM